MREVKSINSGWAFHKGDTRHHKIPKKIKKGWEIVELPHTWNAADGQDGGFDSNFIKKQLFDSYI